MLGAARFAPPTVPILFLDGLDGDGQGHFVADVRSMFARVEFRALDPGGGVGSAGIFFEHGVGHALEGCHGERHRLGHALDG